MQLRSREEAESSPTCHAGNSEFHLQHSKSQNNAECMFADDSKIDDMKGGRNQLTSLKQLSDSAKLDLWQKKHCNKPRGSRDVELQTGSCVASKTNSYVFAISPFSTNESSNAAQKDDALALKKSQQNYNNSGKPHTVKKPVHRVGSNRLSAPVKSHDGPYRASMSSNDLIKLLRKFNITLKAVPANSTIAKILAKSTQTFAGTVDDSQTPSEHHRGSNEPSEFQAVNCHSSRRFYTSTKSNAKYKSHCKTTCTGTFSKWKLDESFAKFRSAYYSDNGVPKVDHKKGDSQLRTSRIAKIPKRQLTPCRNWNSIRGCSEKTLLNNGAHSAKESSASYAYMPLHDIPLAKAYDDLENRDKATRETLEIFSEEISERKSMSGGTKDVLLGSINSRNDPLLTAAAFRSANDEVDEFALRVSTVIVKPARCLIDQSDTSMKMSSKRLDNCSQVDDALFYGQKKNTGPTELALSTSFKSQTPAHRADDYGVSTHGKCTGSSTVGDNIKVESMDVDHTYYRE